MKCIACGKEQEVVRSFEAPSLTGSGTFTVEFCSCGLGKTAIPAGYDFSELNSFLYSDIENRIRIYYDTLNHHIRVRYVESLKFIERYVSGKKLMELGSNIGFTLSLARANGWNAYGCELNEKSRAFTELVYNIPVYPDFFEVNDTFDVIIMNDVLEHFPQPEKAVGQARKLLNKGGVVFVQLPNIASREAEKRKEKWPYLLVPDHTYHFTQATLARLFHSYGFGQKWSRTVDMIEDKWWVRMLPQGLKNKVTYFLHHNSFYWPKFYERKKGSLIQSIFKSDDVTQ